MKCCENICSHRWRAVVKSCVANGKIAKVERMENAKAQRRKGAMSAMGRDLSVAIRACSRCKLLVAKTPIDRKRAPALRFTHPIRKEAHNWLRVR